MHRARLETEPRGESPARPDGPARERARSRRLMHPLCGADLGTLAAVLSGSGPLAREHLPQAGLALLVAFARWPSTALERLAFAGLRRRTPPHAPPIFIIGHWRSGTTHLYNVLTRAPHFAYVPPLATGLPWDFLGLGRVLRPLVDRSLPEERFIDRIPVRPDSPQEDEIALANMTPLSFYHGIYFPRHLEERVKRGVFFAGCGPAEIDHWRQRHVAFLGKIALSQPGRRLLIKNPVYTARIRLLREIWPGAKFVHIHRDPLRVFASTRNFYARLLREFALQALPELDLDELILATYERMMARFLEDVRQLEPDSLVEIRFAAFERDPVGEIERVYATLGLPGFADARPAFEAYLESVRDYAKGGHRLAPEDAALVRRRLARFIEHWGYAREQAATG